MPTLPTGADIPTGPTLETALDRMRRASNFLSNGAILAMADHTTAPVTMDIHLRAAESMIAESRAALTGYLTPAVPAEVQRAAADFLYADIALRFGVDPQPSDTEERQFFAPATLPNDCSCRDREAIVTPQGLTCGTCGKVIDPTLHD